MSRAAQQFRWQPPRWRDWSASHRRYAHWESRRSWLPGAEPGSAYRAPPGPVSVPGRALLLPCHPGPRQRLTRGRGVRVVHDARLVSPGWLGRVAQNVTRRVRWNDRARMVNRDDRLVSREAQPGPQVEHSGSEAGHQPRPHSAPGPGSSYAGRLPEVTVVLPW